MMKETPPTLTLEATTFNKPQLQEQLSVLEQRQEAQIALAGRSNVGKSSLVNALARRKQLAKISATPGKDAFHQFLQGRPRRLFSGRSSGLRLCEVFAGRAQELGQAH